MEGLYLITTNDWFTAPDGKDYKAAWGEVKILSDGILGVKTNSRSANWFAQIGNENNHIIIAGCQIFYAIKCKKTPVNDKGETWSVENGELKNHTTPSKIYIAE
jgi:hypothetical protein